MCVDQARMRGAVFVAIAAAIGNFLQGWDNATIAGIFASSNIILYNHDVDKITHSIILSTNMYRFSGNHR